MEDWNWFFSALAQSTAAIVGILGAFIFTKIINNQREFNSQKREISEIISIAEFLKERTKQRYYLQIFELILYRVQELVDKDFDFIKNEIKYYPLYIENIENNLEEMVKVLKNDHTMKAIDLVINFYSEYKHSRYKYPYIMHKDLNSFNEKVHIQELNTDIKIHVAKIKSFLNEINEDELSSPLITWSIKIGLILFFVGVIYPLHFLPIPENTTPQITYPWTFIMNTFRFFYLGIFVSKWGTLIIMSIIFLVIMIKFLKINQRLKHSQETKEQLKSYTSFGDYFPYLKGLDKPN